MASTVGTVTVGPAPYGANDGKSTVVPLEQLTPDRSSQTQTSQVDLEACTRFWKMVMEATR